MGQSKSREESVEEMDASEHVVMPRERTWQSTLNVYDNDAQIERIIAFYNLYRQNKYNIPFEILYEIFFQYGDVQLQRQVKEEHLMSVANGHLSYISLPLHASPLYEIQSIDFKIESKDQGWSSYPSQHGTRENSNTWFVVVIPSLLPLWTGCTIHRNIHAGKQWEVFQTSFTKKSNSELFAKVVEEWRRSIAQDSSPDEKVAVVLQAHAAYPGWVNHIHGADIRLSVIPTETFLSDTFHTVLNGPR